MNAPATALSGLPRRIVRDGLLAEDQVAEISKEAKRDSAPVALKLVESGGITGASLAKLAADEFGIPLFDIDVLAIKQIPENIVDQKLIQKHFALPLIKRGNRLFVGVADPSNLRGIDEIKFNTGCSIEQVVVEADKLATKIEAFLNAAEETIGDALGI